jgi:hypothetical protein
MESEKIMKSIPSTGVSEEPKGTDQYVISSEKSLHNTGL